MEQQSPKELILRSLKEKSSLKQDIFQNTSQTFALLKTVVKEVAEELNQYHKTDKRVTVEYKDVSDRQVQIRVAGDTVIFYMHTNIFDFDKSHRIW